jgi:RNA polymerase sigma-70 factor (ECF subfamily)
MSDLTPEDQVGPLVDRLFRRESGRITAWLLRWLGPGQAALAEDAVQEALLSALRAWPFRGVPQDPSAWLWRVARNAAIDRIRKNGKEVQADRIPEVPDTSPPPGTEDAELLLLFLCADPVFPADTAVPLTLKLACGFSDGEIAGALSVETRTVQQRIVRAKRRWRETRPVMDLAPHDLDLRCGAVMNVIYLMLNEGYGGHHPDHWQRMELCVEATRLALLLARHNTVDRRDVEALTALCLFQAARTPGRTSQAGDILLLDQQDRDLWDRKLIAEGFEWLDRSGHGTQLTTYHLLAGIASCHVAATTYGETNWSQIVSFYDQLVTLDPGSPYHRLNRAIAIAENGSPAAAMDELDGLGNEPTLAKSYLLPAARAWVQVRLGGMPEARRDLMLAISRAPSGQIRDQLSARLEAL